MTVLSLQHNKVCVAVVAVGYGVYTVLSWFLKVCSLLTAGAVSYTYESSEISQSSRVMMLSGCVGNCERPAVSSEQSEQYQGSWRKWRVSLLLH